MSGHQLARWRSPQFGARVAGNRLVILQPVGSVEPHGPHLSLGTDTVISHGACERAATLLEERSYEVGIAPAIPYGVTECAAAFPGAISVDAASLSGFLRAVVEGYLRAGALHVCLVNNHLEPAQDQAVRAAIASCDAGRASVACPLTRRWGRQLTDEYKSGQCHAGQYETSIVLACEPESVDLAAMQSLPEVAVSLSDNLRAGVTDFFAMGMAQAYAGRPASANAAEGHTTLAVLAEMIATEVLEALGAATSA